MIYQNRKDRLEIKQTDKDTLSLLLILSYLKHSNEKLEDYIEGYDQHSFQEKMNKHPYFIDDKKFDRALKTMLTEKYKKFLRSK